MPISPENRLSELGIALPHPAAPVANYVPASRTGNLLMVSGQLGFDLEGKLTAIGKVGAEVSVEEAYKRARIVGLQLLSATREALGSLDRVDTVVKMLCMVNAIPEFKDHPKVANGMSDLFVRCSARTASTAARLSAWARCQGRSRSRSKAFSRSSLSAAYPHRPGCVHSALSIGAEWAHCA
jgi:enamine deaminase RidA (YjgF/YER057c/UK114 family)